MPRTSVSILLFGLLILPPDGPNVERGLFVEIRYGDDASSVESSGREEGTREA